MIDLKLMAATGAIVLAGGMAQATTLTFDLTGGVSNNDSPGAYGDNVAGTNEDASGSGAAAAGSYGVGAEGTTENVAVSYQGAIPSLWTTGYSDLTNVLFVEPDGTSGFGFTLTADSGFAVTLSSFDLGNFGGAVVLPSVSIFADGLSVFSALDYALGSSSSPSQTIFGSYTGSIIQVAVDLTGLGGQSDNIGIDNVTFSQSTVMMPIPLPAGLPLLLAGLGTFGFMRRRKNKS